MPPRRHTRADDEHQLAILDMADHDGGPAARARFGLTNSTLQGLRARTTKAAGEILCECKRPENIDGGMPRRWWKDWRE